MKEIPQDVSMSTKRRNPHLYTGMLAQDIEEFCPPTPKRIRQSTKPLMNKLENEYLNYMKMVFTGEVITSQALKFNLANGLWYKPDFVVFFTSGSIVAYECKGPHAFRGGFENLKIAARLYVHITWFLVWKDGGEWKKQEVLP